MAPRSPTLEEKRVYYAKVRAANYAASLRLEGFVVPPSSKEPTSTTSDSSAPNAVVLPGCG